ERVPVRSRPRIRRDADGTRDVDWAVLGVESRPFELGTNALGQKLRALRVRFLAGHDELLAAESTDQVSVALRASEDVGEAADHVIAHVMSVGIVDFLEMVEVADQDAERLVEALRGANLLLGELREGPLVQEPGE